MIYKSKRCWAEIDLAALERNLGKIRLALPRHMQYIAVVKADAYGHGVEQTVARLMQSGADYFAVANVYEGAEVREIGAGWPIIVFGSVLPEEEGYLFDYNLTATLSTVEEAKRLNTLAEKKGQALKVHIKIDTGMGRMGVWHTKALPVYEAVQNASHLQLGGLFTHFSSADTSPDFTLQQRNCFLDTIRTFPNAQNQNFLIHADNSAGLETFSSESPFNAVRIGLLQFGLLPHPNSLLSKLKTEPVMSFHSRIGLIKKLPAGTPISYGRTHILERESRVGIITAGYGDGIPVAASNKAQVLIRGKRSSIIGRVTMDQTMVDLTDNPEVQSGDTVTLIGNQEGGHIGVREFSKWCNCIPWETFCSITKRVPRVYRTSRAL